jgi:hypothetical protein
MAHAADRDAALAGTPERVRIGDIFASAFTRYGGNFATLGLIALALCALPAAAWLAAEGGDAGAPARTSAVLLAGTLSYFVLVGAATVAIGRRVRARALPIALTAVLSCLPMLALIIALPPQMWLIAFPFLLPLFVLAPVVSGAEEAAGVAALRRAFALVVRRGYWRAAGVSSGAVLLGIVLWIAIALASSPIPSSARPAVVGLLWFVIYGPLSALVFRALYGALSGRLTVQRGPAG